MRVGLVFFAEQHRERLLSIADGFRSGLESCGHQVDVIDGDRDINTKLTIYRYIIVGAVSTGTWGGKISEKVGKFLANSGMVSGKKSFAFILGKGLRCDKALRALMSVMEHEGMFLKSSEILNSAEGAEAVGKRLHIAP